MGYNSQITIYEALDLNNLDLLKNHFNKLGVRVYSDLYAPSRKLVNKTNTYYELWAKTLASLADEDGPVVILGSYWVERTAISSSLGMQSGLSEEEFLSLIDIESEMDIKKVLVVSSGDTHKDTLAKITASYSSRFPTFSGVESKRVYSSMLELTKKGFESVDLADILGENSKQEKEELYPIDSEEPEMPDEQKEEKTVVSLKQDSDVVNKLVLANAISSIVDNRIIKKQGAVYDSLDEEVRAFLKEKLESIFQPKKELMITKEDVSLVKTFVNQLKTKMESRK